MGGDSNSTEIIDPTVARSKKEGKAKSRKVKVSGNGQCRTVCLMHNEQFFHLPAMVMRTNPKSVYKKTFTLWACSMEINMKKKRKLV
jgi:hypothetical protein